MHGRYAEARTATVFAGACHYQSEYDTGGSEAVLAWSFEGGRHLGTDLAGLEVVAAVVGDANLAEADAQRESVLYLSADTPDCRREAVLDWLETNHAGELGRVLEVRCTEVAVEVGEESFEVRAADAVALQGDALPDRGCCAMPFQVWYEPFEAVEGALVGLASFHAKDAALDRPWRMEDTNCAFFGAFGSAVPAL